jgi:hypothetical protein
VKVGENMDILPNLKEFADGISRGRIEIYNEASIQFELAIYLRARLGNKYKIQLERNIKYFNPRSNYVKKEMDIFVFTPDEKEKHCVELKFPTYGEYPEQMFGACKDIKFLEQLIKSGFSNCYFMMFANDSLFYTSKKSNGCIYKIFRNEKLIKGKIRKPTGKKDVILNLIGEYKIEWRTVKNNLKYFVIEVKN